MSQDCRRNRSNLGSFHIRPRGIAEEVVVSPLKFWICYDKMIENTLSDLPGAEGAHEKFAGLAIPCQL
jgi:hypothetical protein